MIISGDLYNEKGKRSWGSIILFCMSITVLVHSGLHYSYLRTHIKFFLQPHPPPFLPPTHPSDSCHHHVFRDTVLKLAWILPYLICFCDAVSTYTNSFAVFDQCLPIGWAGKVAGGFHSGFANEWITTLTWMSLESGNFFAWLTCLFFLTVKELI